MKTGLRVVSYFCAVIVIVLGILLLFVMREFSSSGDYYEMFFVYILLYILCTVMGLGSIIGGILIIYIPIHRDRLLAKSPEQITQAKLISKSTAIRGGYVFAFYYFTFEMPDTSRKVFQVNGEQYNTVLENEMGDLIYKEHKTLKQFLNFKRNV